MENNNEYEQLKTIHSLVTIILIVSSILLAVTISVAKITGDMCNQNFTKIQDEITKLDKETKNLSDKIEMNDTNDNINQSEEDIFNKGYECGYGFGYIDCHDGEPYRGKIPNE